MHYVSTSRRGARPGRPLVPCDKLATRLARAQLVPVPATSPARPTTAVPAGARLLGDAVSVESGVATVNLISSRLSAGEANRQNLWAQFVSTLTQDTGVTRVALSVNGVPVDLDGLDGTGGHASPRSGSARLQPLPLPGRSCAAVTTSSSSTRPALGEQEPRQPAGVPHLPAGAAGLPPPRALGRRHGAGRGRPRR